MLLVRLIVGGIFVYNGWMKVSQMEMTIGFFSKMHIPTFLTYIVSYGELIGGVFLVLGLWTTFVSSFLSIIMVVAIYKTFPNGPQMFILPLSVLGGLIAIIGCGGGKFAVSFHRGSSSQER